MREFNAAKVPKPKLEMDLSGIFFRGPVDLEIGAGQGLHAIRYARSYPDRTLLAVERTHLRFARLHGRSRRHPDLRRLLPIHADARSFVAHCIPDASLEKIFILYPNPHPKAKQANLRWHNSPFCAELIGKLKPGGELVLATNLKWYADEAADRMTRVWKLILEDFRILTDPARSRTHFERKYLLRGEPCFDLRFAFGNSRPGLSRGIESAPVGRTGPGRFPR